MFGETDKFTDASDLRLPTWISAEAHERESTIVQLATSHMHEVCYCGFAVKNGCLCSIHVPDPPSRTRSGATLPFLNCSQRLQICDNVTYVYFHVDEKK